MYVCVCSQDMLSTHVLKKLPKSMIIWIYESFTCRLPLPFSVVFFFNFRLLLSRVVCVFLHSFLLLAVFLFVLLKDVERKEEKWGDDARVKIVFSGAC